MRALTSHSLLRPSPFQSFAWKSWLACLHGANSWRMHAEICMCSMPRSHAVDVCIWPAHRASCVLVPAHRASCVLVPMESGWSDDESGSIILTPHKRKTVEQPSPEKAVCLCWMSPHNIPVSLAPQGPTAALAAVSAPTATPTTVPKAAPTAAPTATPDSHPRPRPRESKQDIPGRIDAYSGCISGRARTHRRTNETKPMSRLGG
jgi:hypothetical protein